MTVPLTEELKAISARAAELTRRIDELLGSEFAAASANGVHPRLEFSAAYVALLGIAEKVAEHASKSAGMSRVELDVWPRAVQHARAMVKAKGAGDAR